MAHSPHEARELVSRNRSFDDSDADAFYRLLADRERRALLGVLLERSGPISMEDLRGRLADVIGEEDHAGIRLHHVHLPKLDEAGLVEYDPAAGRIAPTEAAQAAQAFV